MHAVISRHLCIIYTEHRVLFTVYTMPRFMLTCDAQNLRDDIWVGFINWILKAGSSVSATGSLGQCECSTISLWVCVSVSAESFYSAVPHSDMWAPAVICPLFFFFVLQTWIILKCTPEVQCRSERDKEWCCSVERPLPQEVHALTFHIKNLRNHDVYDSVQF